FLVYYTFLGLLMVLTGGYFILRNKGIKSWISGIARRENPPLLIIRILKYLALFTLPGLVLTFFPFSLIELIFCIWSLIILYIAGTQLVRWEQSRVLIQKNRESISNTIRKAGAIMLSVGFAIFLLAYSVVERATG
ncbi:MAG TPA: hypothetical protein VK074_09500, partial [Fodinibius sp.]|nr:hypothetical protein [Fodinibius sp.]